MDRAVEDVAFEMTAQSGRPTKQEVAPTNCSDSVEEEVKGDQVRKSEVRGNTEGELRKEQPPSSTPIPSRWGTEQ